MTDLLRIDIDGGKYTLVQHEGGGTELLRYGEPWLKDLHGANVFLAMGYELEELRPLKALLKEAGSILDEIDDLPMADDGSRELPAGSLDRAREIAAIAAKLS